MSCERCGASPEGFELYDYCAFCSANLCEKCMAEGCCDEKPAVSGMENDNQEA